MAYPTVSPKLKLTFDDSAAAKYPADNAAFATVAEALI